jgi:hypothetical protein
LKLGKRRDCSIKVLKIEMSPEDLLLWSISWNQCAHLNHKARQASGGVIKLAAISKKHLVLKFLKQALERLLKARCPLRCVQISKAQLRPIRCHLGDPIKPMYWAIALHFHQFSTLEQMIVVTARLPSHTAGDWCRRARRHRINISVCAPLLGQKTKWNPAAAAAASNNIC